MIKNKLELSLLNLIYKNVKKNPSNICLEKGLKKITYKNFWDSALNYANYLIKNCKKKTPIVCIYEEKDFFDYIAIIGTLISGGYFIPINKATPLEKVFNIIKYSNANFFSANNINDKFLKKNNVNHINEKKIIFFDKSNIKIKSSNLAYILFTSGTTGNPKGVMIKKKSLDHYIGWLVKRVKINKNTNCSQIPSIGFDLSVADIYLSLCSGSKLIIPEKIDNIFPAKMIYKKQINHIVCTPSLVDYINSSNQLKKKYFKSVKSIFFCGEPLYEYQIKSILKINQNIKFINTYGPTETTCSMTYSLINKLNYKYLSDSTMTIGKPIPGMNLLLIDSDFKKNKKEGEILISGPQLSIGYLKQKKETDKRFITFNKKKYFRTGDLGFKKNGNYYFRNRIDYQIKIKGYRVELNEINYYLRYYGFINAHTIYFKNKIISFVKIQKYNEIKLKKFLKKKLELYKIPSEIISLKKFPLNKNGKIDNNLLKQYIIKNEN